MQTFCDRCNELADHLIPIADDPELSDIARDLGYRSVCSGCYDDLVIEANESREHLADDRRAEHRVAVELAIQIVPTDGGDPQEAVTEDISENGARVRAVRGLEPGSVVRVMSSDGSAEAVAIVEVIWNDFDGMRVGLRLVEASESWAVLVRESASAAE